jgi:hypothetical protein
MGGDGSQGKGGREGRERWSERARERFIRNCSIAGELLLMIN